MKDRPLGAVHNSYGSALDHTKSAGPVSDAPQKSRRADSDSRRLVLLLSATVDPGGVVFVKRNDPKQRLKDYRQALKRWGRVSGFDSIVFCENSGADLSSLHNLAARLPGGRQRIRFISFHGNAFAPTLGKGYGEMGILKRALSELTSNQGALVMKVTGRYFVRNIGDLLERIRTQPGCEVYCNIDSDLSFANSGAFAASPSFFEKYLFPLHESINDSANVFFEHVLAEAIRTAAADGVKWAPWSGPLRLAGVSGTCNLPYSGPAATLNRAKMWALERTYRVRHLLGLYRRRRSPQSST